MTVPEVPGGPYELPSLDGSGLRLWDALLELSEARPQGWTLIGGQMVLLHAVEHGVAPPRISQDLDVLVNARVAAGNITAFARALASMGYVLDGASPEGIAHRYRRGEVSVDVLAPEGLGPRANLVTTPPGRTLEVPGGTQALQRTERVWLQAGGRSGRVPRPSLLGAIVGKALAVDVDDVPDAQRHDLVFLLSLVADPIALRGELTNKDRQRLAKRTEINDRSHRAWRSLSDRSTDDAYAAWRLLTARPT